MVGVGRFRSTGKSSALVAGMLQVVPVEESAEGIVVTSESVSSCVSSMRNEECGKPLWSKARTKEEEATGGAL